MPCQSDLAGHFTLQIGKNMMRSKSVMTWKTCLPVALALLCPPATLHAQAKRGDPMVEIQSVGMLTRDQIAGQTLFSDNCAVCHGTAGVGSLGMGPPLIHRIYEPSHHGDMSFVLAAKRGVRAHHWRFGNMPPQPQISDQEIALITAYVRAVQRANGIQ